MKMTGQRFARYNFEFIAEIRPTTDHAGDVIEYRHQLDCGVRPNRHAAGPFCKFRVESAPRLPGVYLIKAGDELKYIGECADLSSRFGAKGYGNIAPRNCHSDGQATNSKINALILAAAKAGHPITLWFHASSYYKTIETTLINQLHPPWNSRKQGIITANVRPSRSEPAVAEMRSECEVAVTAEAFQIALEQELAIVSARGDACARVRAGDLHSKVGGYPGKGHRMPVCCRVMRAMMREVDVLVDSPPKGIGSRLTIEYKLPRA